MQEEEPAACNSSGGRRTSSRAGFRASMGASSGLQAAQRLHKAPALRPTASEHAAASAAIARMEEIGILTAGGRRPDVATVACAMAIRAGETFASERAAKRVFGKRPEMNVRQLWVDGYLAQLAEHEATNLRVTLHSMPDQSARRVVLMIKFPSGNAYQPKVVKVDQRRPKRMRDESADSFAARKREYEEALDARRLKEGQCEGWVPSQGRRCHVTAACRNANAEPLRQGGRYCAHHQAYDEPPIFCTGTTMGGEQPAPCKVHSRLSWKEAEPLRYGSPFCHHHRQACQGWVQASERKRAHVSERCRVTSSSRHDHAEPLRHGERYCAHHAWQATGQRCDACERIVPFGDPREGRTDDDAPSPVKPWYCLPCWEEWESQNMARIQSDMCQGCGSWMSPCHCDCCCQGCGSWHCCQCDEGYDY